MKWRIDKRSGNVGGLAIFTDEQIADFIADIDIPIRANGRAIAEARARLIAAAPEMHAALGAVFEALDNRYDGAPDSRTLWMGEHITEIRRVLAKAVRP